MASLTSSLIIQLVDQVSRPARRIGNAMAGVSQRISEAGRAPIGFATRLDAALTRNNRSLAAARGGLVDAAAGFYALRFAIVSPVQAAMEFESAMADVRKVVDFPTPEAFEQFQASLLEMSRRLPMSVNQLAEMAAIGGSSGLSGDTLIQFVDQAARLGVAFDITAEQAGDFQNAMRNALGMDLTQVLALGDAINHVSNSMAATAPDLTNFMTRVAGDLSGFGFSAEEATAFGAAMIASGHNADVAATSFRNMGRYLTLGASNSNRTKNALRAIGLEATDVAKRMQEDAVATTVDVFERIGQMPQAVQAALRADIFGNEARALPGVISNLDLLREALGYVEDESQYAGSAFREFEARAGTFQNAAQIFHNRLQGLQAVIGAALIPAINGLMETISPVVDQITRFAQAHPELVSNAMAAASALVALRVASAGLRFVGLLGRGGALSLLSIGLNTVGRASMGLHAAAAANIAYTASLARMAGAGSLSGLQRLRAALRGMAFAVPGVAALSGVLGWLAGAAAALGTAIAGITAPVWGAIAVAVAAVAAAGYSLWKWWDRITATLSGVARRLAEELEPALDAIRPVLEAISPVTEAVGSAFSTMGDAIGSVIDWFQARWGEFTSWISGFFQREVLTEAEAAEVEQHGYDIADRVVNAIKGVFEGLLNIGRMAITKLLWGMRDRLQALRDWAGEIPGRIGEVISSLSADMLAAGRAAIQSLWDGAVERFHGFIEWVRGIPGRILSAIGSIDLSSIIDWPDPPAWWTYLFGGDEPEPATVPAPRAEPIDYGALPESQASAAAVLEQAMARGIPNAGQLQDLRDYVAHLRAEMAAIQGEMDSIVDGPMRPTIVAPMEADMRRLQAELDGVQTELAEGEQATADVTAALQVLSDTDATPEVNTESITRALEQVRALSRELSSLRSGPVGAQIPVDGARAGGGDVRSGGTYLVGEEGPELVTFGQSGFVHTARQTARMLRGAASRFASGAGLGIPSGSGFNLGAMLDGGVEALRSTSLGAVAPAAVAGGNVTLRIDSPLIGSVTISNGQNPLDLVDQIGEALEARLARAMRGLHADGVT